MKSFLLYLACSFAALTMYAGNMIKIHGKIKNALTDSISVEFNIDKISYSPKAYVYKIDKEGNFQVTFPVVDRYTKLDIVHGKEHTDLIVMPGFDLTMELNAQNFDSSLQYSGKGSREANFCARHELLFGNMLSFERKTLGLFPKEPEDFIRSLDSLLNTELTYLEQNGTGLDKGFAKYWEANYRYSSYNNLLLYPTFHEMHKQKSYTVKNIPQEDYVTVAKAPETFDDDMLSLVSYQVYLERLYNKKLEAGGLKNDPNDAENKYRADDSALKLIYTRMPPKTAEYHAAWRIYRYSKYAPVERSEKELGIFKKHFPNSEYLPSIQKAFDAVNKTSEGKPAIDFTINTIDGKTMKLSDLKGKVVMIDFWASWCVPCIGEMPHANKIEEYYKDKDVVFLYVSIDENEENWKKGIELHKIAGMHMRDSGGFKGSIAKLYGVEGVPSYYLVDKNGKFAKRPVPRPSDGEKLKAVIDALLK